MQSSTWPSNVQSYVVRHTIIALGLLHKNLDFSGTFWRISNLNSRVENPDRRWEGTVGKGYKADLVGATKNLDFDSTFWRISNVNSRSRESRQPMGGNIRRELRCRPL